MLTYTDAELVKHLAMEDDGPPVSTSHHTVQKKRFAGRSVNTMEGGRLVRVQDALGDTRSGRRFGTWLSRNDHLIATTLGRRLTIGFHLTQINGGKGDPGNRLEGRTGRYISILFYASLVTIGADRFTEWLELTGSEKMQWHLLLMNTPVSLHPEGGIEALPGIVSMLSEVALSDPTPQNIEASRYVSSLRRIHFSPDGSAKDSVEPKRARGRTRVVPAVDQSDDTQEIEDLVALIKKCPTRVQVKLTLLEADNEHHKSQLEQEKTKVRHLEEERSSMVQSHTANIMKMSDTRVAISDNPHKGVRGEARVKELLEQVFKGKYLVVPTRSEPDYMDLHVHLPDKRIIAVEVKLHKNPVGPECVKKFYSNITTLSRHPEHILVGAMLISLASFVTGFNDKEMTTRMHEDTKITMWIVNRLELMANPVASLESLIMDHIYHEIKNWEGRVVSEKLQRGEPIEPHFINQLQYILKVIEDTGIRLPRGLVSEITEASRDVARVVTDGEGRLGAELISVEEGVRVLAAIDPETQTSGALIEDAAGNVSTLTRHGDTGAVVATASCKRTGRRTKQVLTEEGSMVTCRDDYYLPEHIPKELHDLFIVTKPWGSAQRNVADVIMKLCVIDPTSRVNRKDLIALMERNGLQDRDERGTRNHITHIIKQEKIVKEGIKVFILGLRLREED